MSLEQNRTKLKEEQGLLFDDLYDEFEAARSPGESHARDGRKQLETPGEQHCLVTETCLRRLDDRRRGSPAPHGLGGSTSGFPDSPPGDRSPVLVGGLQTVLTPCPMRNPGMNGSGSTFCRSIGHLLPSGTAWGWYSAWTGRRSCSHSTKPMIWFLWSRDRPDRKVLITRGMWNGAATGSGAYQLIVPGTKEVGGYHVQRIS